MPSFEVKVAPRFLRDAQRLSAKERRTVNAAIGAAVAAWGNPHSHGGAGIRRLRGDVFECRCGLGLRLVFLAGRAGITFFALGTHDAIRKLLKTL